jgi:hypothetical protein
MRTIPTHLLLSSVLIFSSTDYVSAQVPDPHVFHRMHTQFLGLNRSLDDVFNGGPNDNMTHFDILAERSGQFWRFAQTGDGFFRLSTLFRGPGMCLDTFNGGENDNQPHLAPCANFSGQFWTITPITEVPPLTTSGFFARLTTKFRGPGMCLDVFNGGPNDRQPHLAPCGNFSGQFWYLSPTEKRVD